MVFTKDRHPHKWTQEEQLKLLMLWKSEKDWKERSSKMYQEFPDRRGKGFFSPTACHHEFEKLIHSSAPNQVALPASTSGYRLTSLVDIWIDHLKKEVNKEYERVMEECLVDIRSSYALIERLMTGKPEMNDDQMLALLEEMRSRDAKRGPQADIIVNVYMRKLLAIDQERKQKGQSQPVFSPLTIPPTKSSEIVPRGSETVFRSPSPLRSPIKSPIRRVADAVREGITPIKIDTPKRALVLPSPKITPDKKTAESQILPDSSSLKPDVLPKTEPNEATEMETELTVESAGKNAKSKRRSRIERESSADTTGDNATKTPRRTKRGRSLGGNLVPLDLSNQNAVKVETPASPLGPPPEITKSSRSTRRRGTARTSRTGDFEKKESDSRATSFTEERPPSTPTLEERFATVHVQTDISVQHALTASNPEKKERRPSTSRKTRASRVEVSDDSQYVSTDNDDGMNRDVSTQCIRLELERDDKIVIIWDGAEKPFIHTVNLEEPKIELKEEEVDSLSAKSIDEDIEDKRAKGDKKDVIFEVDAVMARALLTMGYVPEDDGVTPAKRANLRKDDKVKEENNQTKTRLLNAWRVVEGHRHASIFMNPVTDREAHNYSSLVHERMDLTTLRKEIEAGIVSTMEQFKMKIMKMFANAVMFNSSDHDINMYTKDMARETLEDLKLFKNDESNGASLPFAHHPRRSRAAEEESDSRLRNRYRLNQADRKAKEYSADNWVNTESITREVSVRRKRPANKL